LKLPGQRAIAPPADEMAQPAPSPAGKS